MQLYKAGPSGESARPEFRPDPPAWGTKSRLWSVLEGMISMFFPAFSYRLRVSAAWLSALALVSAFASAEAATKKTDKSDSAKPNLIATFGDWNVFVSQTSKGRICYVLAQPKTREPDGLRRDPGYAFISDRPTEGVRNEVSFIMGFEVASGTEMGAKADSNSDAKPGKSDAKAKLSKAEAKAKAKTIAAPLATVGEENFDLLPKGGNLWVKNAARESALIAEMKKGAALEIKAASLKGNASTDSYSLAGFSQAMERLQKECPSKS
jgi:invasion protein IalB